MAVEEITKEVETTEEVQEAQELQESQEVETFVGNKDVNPDQNPFTPEFEAAIEKYGYSEEKINELITVDPSVVMTQEQIMEADKKAEEDEKNEDTKEGDEKPDEGEDDRNEDESVKKFFEETKISKEEYEGLNEEAQKYITEKYESQSGPNEEVIAIKKEFEEHKKNTNAIFEDPLIQTRINEIQEGKAYLPKSIPMLSSDEYEKIQSAESVKECNEIIDKIVNSRVQPHVSNAWVTLENKNYQKQEQEKCEKLLISIGEIDKEFEVGAKNFKEIENDPQKMEAYNNGLGKIVNYLQEKGETWTSINKKTPKEILAMYNISTGRDQKVFKEVEKQTKKKLFEVLKNPTVAKDKQSRKAKTMKAGANSKGYPTGTGGLAGLDRSTLVEQVANGDTAEYDRLGEYAAATADKKQIDYLKGVWSDAIYLRNKK